MSNSQFLDERERVKFYRVCTVLYLLTLVTLSGMHMYRQFVLGQPTEAWNDIAMLLTVNVILFLGALLFTLGRFNPLQVNPRHLIMGYVGFVLLGLAFTVFKYSVLLDQAVTWSHVWEYLLIIVKVTGILVLLWGVIAYLGHRRLESQLE